MTDDVKTLLEEVTKKIETLHTAQTLYSRQLSPKFNIFDYINTNEMGLSNIIADLLNPDGNHAQQDVFLRLFIKHCLPTLEKRPNWQDFIDNLKDTTVKVEEITWASNTRRRMDIYLHCTTKTQTYGICIENKPYASDQQNQLKDYALELEKRHKDAWHIVYLSEFNNHPSQHSVDIDTLDNWITNNKFTGLQFSQLIDWLKECQLECQNHSVTEFIGQLVKFIQQKFMGIEDMNEEQQILSLVIQNCQSIDTSMKIFHSVETMKKELIAQLKSDLVSNYRDKSYEMNLDNIGIGKRYEQVFFTLPNNIEFICFEFQSSIFNSPILGIKIPSPQALDNGKLNVIKSILADNLSDKNIKSSPLWPAYYEFQPYDWWSSSEPWQMIKKGEMANKILEEVEAIYQLLKDNDCLK